MSIDLARDPVTGDLELPVRFITARADIVQQRLEARIELVRGDWFLDKSAGADWMQVLGQKPDAEIARGVVLAAVLEDPDIQTASVEVELDATLRTASIVVNATLDTGEEITASVALSV